MVVKEKWYLELQEGEAQEQLTLLKLWCPKIIRPGALIYSHQYTVIAYDTALRNTGTENYRAMTAKPTTTITVVAMTNINVNDRDSA